MHPVRKQRLYIVLFIVVGASIAAALIFYALRENMNLFYSPSDIADGKAPLNTRMRAGGMVREGSVQREGEALQVNFIVTDYANDVAVSYEGILPDMFAEGQGVVVTGTQTAPGVFVATEVLAKHDEEYMPPEVSDALEKSGHGATQPAGGNSTRPAGYDAAVEY
jgi:cytochrome c-type biogenesis protein CcmE